MPTANAGRLHEDAQPLEVDAVVVGAGPVGENVAQPVAEAGLETVIVEAAKVGGSCSYYACVPTKAMLRPGTIARLAERTPGVPAGPDGPGSANPRGPALDISRVLEWREAMTSGGDDTAQAEWLASVPVTLVRGRARLVGALELDVEAPDGSHRRLRARHAVVIATGSVPIVPGIPGLHDAAPWTNVEATTAGEIPGRLAVIGGGPAALELATAYADLGSQVTLLARGRVLTRFEPFAGELVAGALADRDVVVRQDAPVERVVRRGGKAFELHVGDGRAPVVADRILVATGREPATRDLGLEALGRIEEGWAPGSALPTDDTLRVHGVEWLYAVGDAAGRAPLTHQGKYEARAAAAAIIARSRGDRPDTRPWGGAVATADLVAVPQVVFTDPQVASVGRTEARAREEGLRIRTVAVGLDSAAGAALSFPDAPGRAQLVIDEAREVIVGATFVGPEAGELLHAATIAIVGEVPLARLWHAVPSFPTVSEVWLRLLEAYRRP